MISGAEAVRCSPYVDADSVVAAAWAPCSGFARPSVVVNAYADAAAALGVEVHTNSSVAGIDQADEGRVAVRTPTDACSPRRRSSAPVAPGHARSGRWSTSTLPIVPLRRQIVFSAPLTPRPPRVPFTIDHTTTTYFHGNDDGSGLPARNRRPERDDRVRHDGDYRLARATPGALATFAPSLADVAFAHGWAGCTRSPPTATR